MSLIKPYIKISVILSATLVGGYGIAYYAHTLPTEQIDFSQDIVQLSQSQSLLQSKLTEQQALIDKLQSQLGKRAFTGFWKHSWGHLTILQERQRGKGILLDQRGQAYLLEGVISGNKFEFGWVSYQRNKISEKGIGYFNLNDEGQLEGAWQGSLGTWTDMNASPQFVAAN